MEMEDVSAGMESGVKAKMGRLRLPLHYFPARYVLCFLTFWAMSLEYAQRLCLSVAIVAMVNHTAVAPENVTDEGDCPSLPDDTTSGYSDMGEYAWSPSVQGVILGAYYYGYVCTQVAGGRLAELFGGKWLLGLAILLGSFLTLVTPAAADLGVVAITCVRIAMGLIHGICLPTAFAMFAQWAPLEERSTLIAVCVIGDHFGTVLSMPLTGYLCENGFAGGWPSVFYVLGTLGCLWFLFWCCLAYNRPDDHPRISQHELTYIQQGQLDISDEQKRPVPWKEVLRSGPVWALAFTTFTLGWGHTTLLTKLPTYIDVVLHIPIQENGAANSLVHVTGCVTLFISGYLSDYLRSKKHFSATNVRKAFQIVALLGPALCTGFIPTAGCNKAAAISLLTLGATFLGFCGGGQVSIAADMAPHYAGTVFGLANGIGCIAGIFSPLVAGFILENGNASMEKWSLVFYISSFGYLLGALVFTIWASAERQPWARTGTSKNNSFTEDSNIVNKYTKVLEDSLKYGSIS